MNKTRHRLKTVFSRLNSCKKCCLVALLSLTCGACSNSKLVLRPLYNSLDDRIEKRFLEYASFDTEQTGQIQELADHFHLWHRKTQLRYYSWLLSDFTVRLKDTKSVDETDVERWSEIIRSYGATVGTCNPIYASADIISNLSDRQIIQIRDNRQATLESRRASRDADDSEREVDELLAESVSGRIKQIRRYLRLVNFTLNQEQLDDLRKTMSSTIRPNTPFRQIRDDLDAEFYVLLGKRKEPDFKTTLISYFDKRRQTFSDRRIDARVHNRKLWEAYTLRTIRSFDNDQRDVATNYLNGLAATINALAADKPSYTKRSASDYECVGRNIDL